MRTPLKISRNLKSIGRIIFGFMMALYIYLAFFKALSCTYEEFVYPNYSFVFVFFTTVGFVIGAAVAVSDVFFLSRITSNLNFLLTLFVRTVFYVIIALMVLLFFVVWDEYRLPGNAGVFSSERYLRTFFFGEFFVLVLFLTIVGIVINSFRLVVQRVGEKNFWNVVVGRYHTPHEEERVFMFLDLYSSTALAESMGHERYHNLLYDVFNDIAEPITTYGGEVYQYVGDSVVITWNIQDGTKRLNCIRCFFDILKRIEKRAGEYEMRYQHVPHMKAGLHAGKVMAGEVGVEKREIVFHGDTVNTAARIQEECVEMGEQILLSEELLFLFPAKLLKKFATRFKGIISLKGRMSQVALYTISEME